MDLKEFIATSLTEIVEGIREAQTRTAGTGAWISPAGSSLPSRDTAKQLSGPNGNQYLDEIKFDVAVSVSDGKRGGGEGALKILAVSVKAGGTAENQRSAVSRIQFSVPVVWPGSSDADREAQIAAKKARNDQAVNAQRRRPGSWMG